MSDSSDFEMQSAPELLLKKTKKMPKPPKSPSEEILDQGPKKIPTKIMIHEALVDLRKGTRKGSSLYAIKKHMAEKYGVDIEKINHIIKKLIKEGVESGTIMQTKGIGASGSFRLPPGNKTEEKKTKPKKEEENADKKSEKPKKIIDKSDSKPKKKTVTKKNKEEDKKTVKKKTDVSKTPKVATKEKAKKETVKGKVEKAKNKMTDIDKNTSIKKKASMLKRKSIGSIIKAPKMRPKMKK